MSRLVAGMLVPARPLNDDGSIRGYQVYPCDVRPTIANGGGTGTHARLDIAIQAPQRQRPMSEQFLGQSADVSGAVAYVGRLSDNGDAAPAVTSFQQFPFRRRNRIARPVGDRGDVFRMGHVQSLGKGFE